MRRALTSIQQQVHAALQGRGQCLVEEAGLPGQHAHVQGARLEGRQLSIGHARQLQVEEGVPVAHWSPVVMLQVFLIQHLRFQRLYVSVLAGACGMQQSQGSKPGMAAAAGCSALHTADASEGVMATGRSEISLKAGTLRTRLLRAARLTYMLTWPKK